MIDHWPVAFTQACFSSDLGLKGAVKWKLFRDRHQNFLLSLFTGQPQASTLHWLVLKHVHEKYWIMH